MDMKNFDKMSSKQLERLLANTFPGSVNHDLIKPVLEAKLRHFDSRRTWTISLISATIAVLGIVVAYLGEYILDKPEGSRYA